ncbi:MAG: PQQ-binding-like beta-propeller repeat protein [Gemmatimonadetes bacterium]|nr:PQQ-binding-like beta-propeller repeat protein [Gemmatimonadota bacterium]
MGTFTKSAVLGLVVAVLSSTPVAAQQGATDGQWRYYGGGPGGTAYSSLDQIDATNVGDLEIAWTWAARNQGPRPETKNSSTPLMVDGVLYVTAGSRRNVVALDAGSGEMLWMWRMDEGERARSAPRANSGRGVAYWSDGQGDDRIYVITPAYHMVALDAHTGREIESFGTNGVVDLRLELDRPVNLIEAVIGSSSPPVIARDVIVVGAALAVGSRPPSMENVPGHVRGYDVRTGERKWIFHTIPQEGEYGNETWEDGSWEYTGNAAVWPPFTVDEELGYVYLPVEDPTGDYYGGHRPGDNLFSSSLVALNIETGERIWHFQMVHHDIWDYDAPTAPILTDITVDGRDIKAVAQITKQAFLYVFDRVTGEPVWPIEERAVPQGNVPGEWYSPTQPFPTKPAPFDRQGITIDDLIDFTPELRAEAEGRLSTLIIGPLYTPPSILDDDGRGGTLMMPSQTGGANWEGGAFDPETGVIYIASKSDGGTLTLGTSNASDMRYVQSFGGRGGRGGQGGPSTPPVPARPSATEQGDAYQAWRYSVRNLFRRVLEENDLDGLFFPQAGTPNRNLVEDPERPEYAPNNWAEIPSNIVNDLGVPTVTVPFSYYDDNTPFVLAFIGDMWSEAELLSYAYVFEQATLGRIAPELTTRMGG